MSPKEEDKREEAELHSETAPEQADHEEVNNSPHESTEMKTEESDSVKMEVDDPTTKDDENDDEKNDDKEKEEIKEDESESPKSDGESAPVSGNQEERASDVDPIYEQNLMKPLFERRDKSLKELLDAMDEFSPIIPDAVIDYYLNKSGFKSSDHRIKRLLALATQKFVADIANDAYQFSRIRAQTANTAGGAGRGRAGPGSTSGRTVLTMESLSGVLGDYGINASRPDFYR